MPEEEPVNFGDWLVFPQKGGGKRKPVLDKGKKEPKEPDRQTRTGRRNGRESGEREPLRCGQKKEGSASKARDRSLQGIERRWLAKIRQKKHVKKEKKGSRSDEKTRGPPKKQKAGSVHKNTSRGGREKASKVLG